MKRLAIITTHPIQYNAPFFRLLSSRNKIESKIFYTWGQSKDTIFDPGFGKNRKWDIPLLDGYNFEFIENVSKHPGSSHYNGIINPTLINAIKKFNPDAILVYGWNFKSHLQTIRHFHGKIPVWFRGDSTLIDDGIFFSFKKLFRKIVLWLIYKNVDKAFYVGNANKLYYIFCGLKEKQLIFAPHAIDNARFSGESENNIAKAKEWRNEMSISENDIVFLFAGKIEPKKNPELLLEAFSKIKDEHTHLIIVGNGILEVKLKDKYKNITTIHFIDFQNQQMMPVVYQLCDIFVLPSKGPGETWGLAVNEAMACGKAVIVSEKCGCASNLVSNDINGNGFIFENNEITDLIDKMKLFINERNLSKLMGKKSLIKISDWSYENICKSIEQELK